LLILWVAAYNCGDIEKKAEKLKREEGIE